MTNRALGAISAVVGVVFTCVLGGALLIGGVAAACSDASPPDHSLAAAALPSGRAAVAEFDAEQLDNASIIVTTGTQLGVPVRGWVIAVATAIQESNLRNLPGGDRDSVGLFQQRPSQGWGSPAEVHDPVYEVLPEAAHRPRLAGHATD